MKGKYLLRSCAIGAALSAVSAVTLSMAEASEPPVAAAQSAPAYSHYVALGDSFTSGPLIPWQRLDPLTCFRSTNNYPSWLAYNLGIDDYTDASCSSADTTNMAEGQDIPLGHADPQLNALKPETDLVTIGIGGNDFSVFGDLVGECPALAQSDPTGSPCKDRYTVGGVDTMKEKISWTQGRLTKVLDAVHERAPEADVMLIGYPRIAPPAGYCPDVLPFADGDLRWLDGVEQALNTALSAAADADGRTAYVDTYTPSLGHDACATGGAAWIQGQALDLFAAYPYHPRKSGMVAVASIIESALTGRGVDAEAAVEEAPMAPGRYSGPVVTRQQIPGAVKEFLSRPAS